MAQSFIHKKEVFSKVFLSEFSAIGSSISCLAGYLRSGNYTGFIHIIGDGGFMNVPGYAIDLKNVCIDNNTLCGLIILANDSSYVYVEYGENILFNESTSITQTSYLQNSMNLGLAMKYLLGDIVIDYVEYSNLTLDNLYELLSYINTWYYNQPSGITIIHYIGPKSLPI